jgi:3-dehydro-L-gulonate-6-phosphate decarboxylase
MAVPMLQCALDNLSLEDALETTVILSSELDVIEAGTILCYAEGMKAVRALRAAYPKHILLADLKVADAGGVLGKMVYETGANWMTVICNAPLATMQKAHEEALKYNGEVQIELYGNWTFEEAKTWYGLGIKQAVYHRGRDAQAAGQTWDSSDLEKIKKLSDIGFEVSVTGGLEVDDIRLFKGIPVKAFIVGRNLRDASDPIAKAQSFKKEFRKYWA